MSDRNTLNVSLTPQLQRFVQAKLASGRYDSASEVVRTSLRLLETHDQKAATREVKAKVSSGLAQANNGRVRDGERVFAEQRARLVKKLNARKKSKS
jgi:antitoxin ParD1/3/4